MGNIRWLSAVSEQALKKNREDQGWEALKGFMNLNVAWQEGYAKRPVLT